METISGSLAISYDPRKEIYTLRFGPALSADTPGSTHRACLSDGRSCGKVRVKLTEALRFLEKAGKSDAAELLARTRVDGGASVRVSITRHQHGTLVEA
jgi:hypothetical protein